MEPLGPQAGGQAQKPRSAADPSHGRFLHSLQAWSSSSTCCWGCPVLPKWSKSWLQMPVSFCVGRQVPMQPTDRREKLSQQEQPALGPRVPAGTGRGSICWFLLLLAAPELRHLGTRRPACCSLLCLVSTLPC